MIGLRCRIAGSQCGCRGACIREDQASGRDVTAVVNVEQWTYRGMRFALMSSADGNGARRIVCHRTAADAVCSGDSGTISMSESAPSLSAPQAAFSDRRKAFRALHERGCFVIPNPWDVGSARYLQHLGFPALATTSAGFAFSQGLPDSGDDDVVSRDRSLAYIAAITAAVDLPVSADFMSGYGRKPEDVAESVTRCVATGVAGLSIEDATGDASSPLYDLPIAVERVRAARQAIDQSGEDVLLTARAECYHVGHPDPFRESVRRLQAYAAAGADVLFAPGPQNPGEIKALVEAVAPKPLNLLVVRDIGPSVGEIAALGVRRISVGGALALAAWTGFIRAARTLKSEGSFAGLAGLVPYAEINGLFATNLLAHQPQGR
jgi:2-methylisocitrate lyase-like PEP mutase family enzyme